MISSKTYVVEDSQGALRVGPLGVSLDSIVIAFQQGQSAETQAADAELAQVRARAPAQLATVVLARGELGLLVRLGYM